MEVGTSHPHDCWAKNEIVELSTNGIRCIVTLLEGQEMSPHATIPLFPPFLLPSIPILRSPVNLLCE